MPRVAYDLLEAQGGGVVDLLPRQDCRVSAAISLTVRPAANTLAASTGPAYLSAQGTKLRAGTIAGGM